MNSLSRHSCLRISSHQILRKPKLTMLAYWIIAFSREPLVRRSASRHAGLSATFVRGLRALFEDHGRNGPDALDERLIELLRKEPRASNRDMAEALGVSEVTVGNRIRTLAERNLVRVTAQEDIWALGYEFIALVDVFVSGRPAEAVAIDLSALEQTGSVSITMTSPELIIQVFARDRADLLQVLEAQVSTIPGIVATESLLVLEALKFRSEFGELESQ